LAFCKVISKSTEYRGIFLTYSGWWPVFVSPYTLFSAKRSTLLWTMVQRTTPYDLAR